MEVATRKSQPIIAAGQPPAVERKLTIEKFADGPITCLKFVGTIDETFDGKKIAKTVECETLVLDLGGVKKISSFGIREWVDFMTTASKQWKQLILIECASKVVDQLNMVANFAGGGRVFSFYAPFRCDYCDSEQRVLLEVAKDNEAIKSMKLAERPCPSCKESMYFDEDGSTYFSYILGQGSFELERDVVAFLAAKLDYRIGTIDTKLRVDKIIDGRITYLRLAGDLNNTFPREKLAEGLEGTVIVDVTGIPRVEPAGAAEWRSFVQMVTPLVENLLLIGVMPLFLEKLCGPHDLGAKVQVVDFALPYTCKKCGTTSAQTIDVATHAGVLKFATAPELICGECKTAMQCTASEAAMTILPGLVKPGLAKELQRKIEELRGKKLEKKPPTGLVQLPKLADQPAARPGLGTGTIALIAIVIAALGAIGILVYQRFTKPEPGRYGLGAVAARSAPQRPAWIKADAPGEVECANDVGASCVGVSQPLASQEDAEDEASDAAYEGIAFRLTKSDRWIDSIAPQVLEARSAAYAALARDPRSTQAKRDVHDGRHAAARVLRRNSTQVAGRYWEAYDTAEGRKYIAFAQVTIARGEADKLVAAYKKSQTALGATVVDFYPEVGWRFPRLDHGAIVQSLDHGVLQELGLAEHYIVLAVDGHDVADAAAFAKLVDSEHAILADRGGQLRLLVQTETGDPREFATTIAGKPTTTPTPHDHGPRSTGDRPPTGGVNVWDRFGGNRGSGRDDPTQ